MTKFRENMNKWIIVAIILLVVGCSVFYSTFHDGFFWDDKLGIVESTRVRHSLGFLYAWVPWRDVDYWAITYNTFWLLWRLGAGSALPFHIFLLLSHVATSFVIWLIAKEFRFKWPLAVALLFLVHPVNAETVAWSIQIKTTLSTLLALISTLLWARYLESGRTKERHLSLLTFACSVLAKTSVVTWPVVLGFVTWWKRDKITRKDVWELAPFFASAVLFGIIAATHNDYSTLLPEDAIRTDNFWGRLVTSGWALWFYLGKAAFPFEVNFMYPRWHVDAAIWWHWLPGCVWALAMAGAWVFRTNPFSKALFAVLFLYPATLAPALGFVDIYFMKYSFVADHWQYQTLPVAIVLLVWIFGTMLGRVSHSREIALGVVVVAMSWVSMQHAKLFALDEDVYKDTVEKNPSAWMAFNQLGNIASDRGEIGLAEKYYKKSIELFPEHKNAMSNLGKLYLKNGKAEQSIEMFKRVLAIDNNSSETWADYCAASATLTRMSDAREQCTKAVELNKANFNGHLNLGYVLRRMQDANGAVAAYEKALQLNPRSLEAAVGLGLSYLQSGMNKDAEGIARVILRNSPGNATAKGILDELSRRAQSN